jgi:hypothetical protein
LPASCFFSAGRHAVWHANDEFLNQAAGYGTPALFQSAATVTLLLLSYTKDVVLWVLLVHALLQMPPEVLNGVEIW